MALNVKHVHFSFFSVKISFSFVSFLELSFFFACACILLSPLPLLAEKKKRESTGLLQIRKKKETKATVM